MSRSTTTTEEFDTEGNLLRRIVEVWEDDPDEAETSLKEDGAEDKDLPEYRFDYRPSDFFDEEPWFRSYDPRQNTPVVSFRNTTR